MASSGVDPDDAERARAARRPAAQPAGRARRHEGGDDELVRALQTAGPERDRAVAALHELVSGAARFHAARLARRHSLDTDEAMTVAEAAAERTVGNILAGLDEFEGPASFASWVAKFAITEAGIAVRRQAWRRRAVDLEPSRVDGRPDTIAAAVAPLLFELSPVERRVLVGVLVRGVPLDVVAERLGESRGSAYAALQRARHTVRARLDAGAAQQPSWEAR